jgi:FixJ family two-component response regulator
LQSPLLNKTGCLIADVQMPNMNGLQLQAHLSSQGLDIPIIFLTAYPDEAVKAQALTAGAVCFLRKGFDIGGEQLFDCLREALNSGSPA